jgi:hypothetical protein
MDRQQVYALAIPYETDLLSAQRNTQEGLGLLALDILGAGPVVSGLGCTPTSPPSLAVVIAPGRLYQLAFLDATAYGQIAGGNPAGGLAADTDPFHQVLKQGLLRDPLTLSCPAPSVAGTSINYLIEVMFQELDTSPAVLPFFNTANPGIPLAGPPGAPGQALNSVRACQCILRAKAGTAAITGTQTTPAADPGWIGLYMVTAAFGQTAVTLANITVLPGAPFLVPGGPQGGGQSPGTYAVDTSTTPNLITAAVSPALTGYQTGFAFRIEPANANTLGTGAVVASINGLPTVSVTQPDGTPLQPGDIRPGKVFDVVIGAGPVLQMLSWPQVRPDKRIAVQMVATSGFRAGLHNHYPVDTSGGPVSCLLAAGPNFGDEIGFSDAGGVWRTNNFTIQGNGHLINGFSANFICNLDNASFSLVFRGGSYGWKVE